MKSRVIKLYIIPSSIFSFLALLVKLSSPEGYFTISLPVARLPSLFGEDNHAWFFNDPRLDDPFRSRIRVKFTIHIYNPKRSVSFLLMFSAASFNCLTTLFVLPVTVKISLCLLPQSGHLTETRCRLSCWCIKCSTRSQYKLREKHRLLPV
jgi:hypothetical protein